MMAEKIDDGRVGFLDLAPEIRNMIYCYCLVLQEDFELKAKGNRKVHRKTIRAPSMKGQLSANILFTCRAVYEEALSVFYGNNVFYLPTKASSILRGLGPHIKRIRQVKFLGSGYDDQRATLHLLKQCPDLERLIISFWQNAEMLGPLIRHIHRKRKGTDKKDALDILEIDTSRRITDHVGRTASEVLEKLKVDLRWTLK